MALMRGLVYLVLGILALPSLATAQSAGEGERPTTVSAPPPPSGVDSEIARSLFEAGMSRVSRAEWSEALELFVRSRALVDRPATALNQALVLVRLGQLRRALDVLLEGELLCGQDEAEVRMRIEAVRTEIAPLIAVLDMRVWPAHASLTIDRTAVTLTEGQVKRALDPGSHQVRATADNFESAQTELTLSKGEHRVLELRLTALPPPPPASAAAPPATLPQAPTSQSDKAPARPLRRNPWLWSAVGVVVIGVALGVGLGLRGESDGQDADGGTTGRIFSPN